MSQYEFQMNFEGEILRLPEQFRNRRGGAKIILMPDDAEDAPARKKPVFNAFRIDTTGFKFNREEANERFIAV